MNATAVPALRRCALALLLCLCCAASLAHASDTPAAATAGPVQQLRIYEIFEDTKPHFHARFRDHALRIMRRYDFRIVAMWETKTAQRTEFAYLLEWPDETTMKDRWSKFMADEEWTEIKRQTRVHGRMVGEIQDRTLRVVPYSPQQRLLD
ncbi:NIPSNAP family protein [Lysobacter sp. Hz 25]|uniref:NIPSNAP family protein n=1 Tax=Lysobacter sp. Hz 25 TaxID=3383698 RepID=UPI0038D3A1BC